MSGNLHIVQKFLFAHTRYLDEMLQQRFLQNAMRKREIDVIKIHNPVTTLISTLRSGKPDESVDGLSMSNVFQ